MNNFFYYLLKKNMIIYTFKKWLFMILYLWIFLNDGSNIKRRNDTLYVF